MQLTTIHRPQTAQACAERLKRNLESIGLSATIEAKAQMIKTYVFWEGEPMGAACIHPPKSGVSTHELKHPALERVVAACASNRIEEARLILKSEMALRQHLPAYAISVASIGAHADGTACYGAAIYKGDECVQSLAGRCDGAPTVGLAVAAAEALEWCNAEGVTSVVIYDTGNVMKWAEGIFNAATAGARMWCRVFNQCDVAVRWMSCDRKTKEFRAARAHAEIARDLDDNGLWDYWNSRVA